MYSPLIAIPIVAVLIAAGPATAPSTQPAIDPQLQARLLAIDARAAHIQSLSADFQQKKFTAVLRKPLLSDGHVRVKGAVARWDTLRPDPSVLLVTEKEVKVYYPAQGALEIYAVDQRLAELAASPLPRLKALQARFAMARIPVSDLDPAADSAKCLALELTPTDPTLREHLQRVRVLMDISAAYMIAAEMTDPDGDRTTIRFDNVKLNGPVGDLELKVAPGTKVTRPLEGLRSAAPEASK